jgi:hypothetical protein
MVRFFIPDSKQQWAPDQAGAHCCLYLLIVAYGTAEAVPFQSIEFSAAC